MGSILSGTDPDSNPSTNGASITRRVKGHGLPLLPENARKGAFFTSTMGDSVLFESWLYHWGSAPPESSVPDWSSVEHIEVKPTDSQRCSRGL